MVPDWPNQTHAFFWREFTELRRLGAEVVPLSTSRPDHDACIHDFADEARRETHYIFPPRVGASVRVLRRNLAKTFNSLLYIIRLSETPWFGRLRAFGLIACAADLVEYSEQRGIEHLHGHSCADMAHVLSLCRLLGGPEYSLTLHGDLQVYGVDHDKKTFQAKFVTAVTKGLQKQLLDTTALDIPKVPVLTMGVDTSRFEPGPEPPSSPFRLLTVARLNPTKGHLYVLEALRILKDEGFFIAYRIAGSGPYEDAILAKIKELNLNGSVEVLGSVGEAEIVNLLRNSHAFILTSEGLGEAAPVSVMEAMSAGLAVVVSRIGGTPEMIDHGVDGLLVDQLDVKGIVDAIRSLIVNPVFRSNLAKAARDRAVFQFDCKVLASKLLDLIYHFRTID